MALPARLAEQPAVLLHVKRPRRHAGVFSEEQLRGDVAVAETLRDEARDLQFLRGQVATCAGLAFPGRLTARTEFNPRSLGPQHRPEPLEGVECGCEMRARLDSPSFAAQELAEGRRSE
jgi:hypothetical protein